MDAGRGLDTMGPNISRSLLLWFVLVLPLLADAAVGASVMEKLVKLAQKMPEVPDETVLLIGTCAAFAFTCLLSCFESQTTSTLMLKLFY